MPACAMQCGSRSTTAGSSGSSCWSTSPWLPDTYGAAPLFWPAGGPFRDGNGDLAGIAGDLALAAEPGYSAAGLLPAALTHGIDPTTLASLRGAARWEGGADHATA